MGFFEKIVLVTGGTSGIGLTTAINFAKNGAKKVYVCGRSVLKWNIAQILIKKELSCADKIIYIQTDVRIENEVRKLIKTIFNENGHLDICVNAAGVNNPPENIWDAEFGSIEKNGDVITWKYYGGLEKMKQTPIMTNLYGTIFCLKWEIKYIFKYNNPENQVNIINVSSSIDEYGSDLYPLYVSSKSGVTSITKSVACQVLKYKNMNNSVPKILINCVNPGYVLSPVFFENIPNDSNINEAIVQASDQIPMGNPTSTEIVSEMILSLSDSSQTKYSTGSRFLIDGGLTASFGYSNFLSEKKFVKIGHKFFPGSKIFLEKCDSKKNKIEK